MSDFVSLADYQDVNSFGFSTMRELDELQKALSAGHDRPPASGGGALRVESLESSLKVLTHQAKHAAFWQKVPKLPAYSTVEEFNQLTSYGGTTGAFVGEGIAPETEDSSYSRQVQLVKFLGTTRVVTHPMTLVRTMIGDVIAQENTNGILWILKNLEWALFQGNADMVYNGTASGASHVEGPEFNGLSAQIDSTQVIDLAGNALTEGYLSDAAQQIASAYGIPTDIFLSYSAQEDLSKIMFPKERVPLPISGADGRMTAGLYLDGINTPFGRVQFNPDVFLNASRTAPTAGSSSTNTPDAPTTVAVAAMAGADGVWSTRNYGSSTAWQGAYLYAVSAVNRYGESAATAGDATLTVGSGDGAKHCVLTITNPSISGSKAPDYFNIYRTAPGGSVKYLITRVAANSITSSGTTTFTDTGYYMANTTPAFMGQLDPSVIAAKQLAPLMKMDLATIAPSYRWMILLYLTFILYAPKKWVRFDNIGRLA